MILEARGVQSQPANKRLGWAISRGHGNYASKVWNDGIIQELII